MSFNYQDLDASELDFVGVAREDEIANGERLFVEVDEFNIVVFNIAGKLFAIGDVCSHDNGPVGDGELEDHEVICPRHGAHFDVRDGKVLSFPAVVDIPAYPIRIIDGQVEVGLPKET
ncbi:MAG: non-heme iron oxygenase ferredoxin subunit [Chloroflexi bacterium]|nr:non-heme iron oxygenase ferredoxin subunit [Chloroflexota bacterium]